MLTTPPQGEALYQRATNATAKAANGSTIFTEIDGEKKPRYPIK